MPAPWLSLLTERRSRVVTERIGVIKRMRHARRGRKEYNMASFDATLVSFHLTAYYLVPVEGDDFRFSLIHGYESSQSNFHYSVFAGYDMNNKPCWVLSYSELPLDAVIFPLECAEEIIRRLTPIR
jgi:hypothetical protein